MKTTVFRTFVGLLVLALAAPAAIAVGGDGRMGERVRAAVENNPNARLYLILTYQQTPDVSDEDKVKSKGGAMRTVFK